MDDLNNYLDKLDESNEGLLNESTFCRTHNFNLEADSLYQKYAYGRKIYFELKQLLDNYRP